jgi:hypothetical protein
MDIGYVKLLLDTFFYNSKSEELLENNISFKYDIIKILENKILVKKFFITEHFIEIYCYEDNIFRFSMNIFDLITFMLNVENKEDLILIADKFYNFVLNINFLNTTLELHNAVNNSKGMYTKRVLTITESDIIIKIKNNFINLKPLILNVFKHEQVRRDMLLNEYSKYTNSTDDKTCTDIKILHEYFVKYLFEYYKFFVNDPYYIYNKYDKYYLAYELTKKYLVSTKNINYIDTESSCIFSKILNLLDKESNITKIKKLSEIKSVLQIKKNLINASYGLSKIPEDSLKIYAKCLFDIANVNIEFGKIKSNNVLLDLDSKKYIDYQIEKYNIYEDIKKHIINVLYR